MRRAPARNNVKRGGFDIRKVRNPFAWLDGPGLPVQHIRYTKFYSIYENKNLEAGSERQVKIGPIPSNDHVRRLLAAGIPGGP
jgi:hypothetical protein